MTGGGKRGQKRGSAPRLIVHSWGIYSVSPVKPASSDRLPLVPVFLFPLDGTPAASCASLHHSLVCRNGSGSGGYNIFLEDSFSSAADHGRRAVPHRAAPEPRRRDNCNSSCVKHRSRGHYSWIRKSSKRILLLFRWPCRPRFVSDTYAFPGARHLAFMLWNYRSAGAIHLAFRNVVYHMKSVRSDFVRNAHVYMETLIFEYIVRPIGNKIVKLRFL